MRKIIAYLATSADGFIARPDGDVAWLDRPRTAGDYGMGRFYRSIDTVVMGRKTYDLGRALGQDSYPGKKNYVFSRRARPGARGKVEFVSEDIARFVSRLRRAKGKHIWLVGGAELFGAFLDAGWLDELVIHVIPTLIGEGIPLFRARHRLVPLVLVGCRTYKDGVVRLHYSVPRSKAAARKSGRAKRARGAPEGEEAV